MSEGRSAGILPGVSKVLVTGATGFIGRHLVARLEAMGKSVACFSRTTGGDIARDMLPFDGVDHVFHLAARTGVMAAREDPVAFVETNALGTARVLEQCRRHGCGLTHVSAYVYGPTTPTPIAEDHPISTSNPYALSKLLAEQICDFYAESYQVPVVILRPFNVYGPGQSKNFLVPFILGQLLDPACEAITVKDLKPCRDYIYVSDVIDGMMQSVGLPSGSVFNLGSGEATSVEDIIKLAMMVSGVTKPYAATGEPRPNEIDTTIADISKLRRITGWSPRVSLAVGLRQMLESMPSHAKPRHHLPGLS